MKRLSHSLILILITYLLAACSSSVFDDYSNCATSSGTLRFRYDADGSSNVLKEYIASGKLFIYDEDGELVHQADLTHAELYTTMGYTLPSMKSGKYRVIVWGNVNHSFLTHQDKLEQAALTTDFTSHSNDALYFASDIMVIGSDPIDKVINFSSAHINMEVHCANFSEVYGQDLSPIIQITHSGSQYLFDQTGIPLPNEFMDYTLPPVYDKSTKTHTTEFKAFRFASTNDITVIVRHPVTNEVLKEVLLQEYIKKLTPPVDQRHELTITIDFVFTPLGVTIKPPVWEGGIISPDV